MSEDTTAPTEVIPETPAAEPTPVTPEAPPPEAPAAPPATDPTAADLEKPIDAAETGLKDAEVASDTALDAAAVAAKLLDAKDVVDGINHLRDEVNQAVEQAVASMEHARNAIGMTVTLSEAVRAHFASFPGIKESESLMEKLGHLATEARDFLARHL